MTSEDGQFPEFVRKLGSDPTRIPAITVYFGFLGPSDTKGMMRIYGSPALSQYVEVPDTAVLHSEPVQNGQLAGQCAFWVDKADMPSSGRTAASKEFIAKQQAAFLEGDIAGRHVPSAGGFGGQQQAFLTSIPCTITATLFLSCLPIDCLPTAH